AGETTTADRTRGTLSFERAVGRPHLVEDYARKWTSWFWTCSPTRGAPATIPEPRNPCMFEKSVCGSRLTQYLMPPTGAASPAQITRLSNGKPLRATTSASASQARVSGAAHHCVNDRDRTNSAKSTGQVVP